MGDDDPFSGDHPTFHEVLDLDESTRADRIKLLSDQTLTHYFNLLSNGRVITNVTVLELMEQELLLRKLPATNRH